jgi:RNA polymerase sigma-70 factor (ECF subfamily)
VLPDADRVRAYLFTTAHHLLISRARKKRPVLFSEIGADGSWSVDRAVAAPDAPPDTRADLSRLEDRLREVLQTLTADHRAAFELAVLQQVPYAEIARDRGWSLPQVKTNVHRARKKVMGALHDLLGPRTESAS